MPETRKCDICNKDIRHRRADAKTCSNLCKSARWHLARYRALLNAIGVEASPSVEFIRFK